MQCLLQTELTTTNRCNLLKVCAFLQKGHLETMLPVGKKERQEERKNKRRDRGQFYSVDPVTL